MGDLLTIYGATGYTGRLCAAEAVRRGLPVRLAGRRRGALDALAGELEREHGSRPEVAVADASDPAQLADLAGSTRALLTTVGPYDRLGRPVVEAALDNGCDYLDISGEVPFLEWVHQQHHRAEAAGVVLAPGVGFDGVPGDLLAAVCAGDLAGEVRAIRVAYLMRGGRVSQGTARSALGVAARGGAAWVGGRLVEEPVATDTWSVPFPGRLDARTAVSVPLPEVVSAGRTTAARTVRAYGVVPSIPGLRLAAEGLARLGQLAATTPAWQLLERAVDLLPEGPQEEHRQHAVALVLVEAAGAGSERARALARVPDMYGQTARFALAFAARLLDPATRPAPGARTPAQVVGEAGAFLDELGIHWRRLR